MLEASRQVGHVPVLPGHRIFQRCAGMSCRSRVSLGSRKNCSQSTQTLHIPHRQHLPGSAGFQLKRVLVRVNLKSSSQEPVLGRGDTSCFATNISLGEKCVTMVNCTRSVPAFHRNWAKTWVYYVMKVISNK